MCGNCPNNQRPWNGGNSVEPEEAHNEFTHKIWVISDQRFVGKCAETAPPSLRPANSGNSLKHIRKLIRSVEYRNECVHQDWYRSLKRKCAETKMLRGRTDRGTDGWWMNECMDGQILSYNSLLITYIPVTTSLHGNSLTLRIEKCIDFDFSDLLYLT